MNWCLEELISRKVCEKGFERRVQRLIGAVARRVDGAFARLDRFHLVNRLAAGFGNRAVRAGPDEREKRRAVCRTLLSLQGDDAFVENVGEPPAPREA